jgi:hypothetical protein
MNSEGSCSTQEPFLWRNTVNRGTLETIGYTEPDALARIDAFLTQQKQRAALIDIRYSPRCRWGKQWNKGALQARYGDRYLHLPCFGNVNYANKEQPIQLARPEEQLQTTVNTLRHGVSLLLLCACKNYDQCHRKTVYDLIQASVEQEEREEQARLQELEASPRMDWTNERPDVMRGPLPDGRLLCTTTENFMEEMSMMPLEYLDDPQNWLSCVDGQTVWIEDQAVQP